MKLRWIQGKESLRNIHFMSTVANVVRNGIDVTSSH